MDQKEKLRSEKYKLQKKIVELQASVATLMDQFEALRKQVLGFSTLSYQDALWLKRNYQNKWAELERERKKLKQADEKLQIFHAAYPEMRKEKISEQYVVSVRRGA